MNVVGLVINKLNLTDTEFTKRLRSDLQIVLTFFFHFIGAAISTKTRTWRNEKSEPLAMRVAIVEPYPPPGWDPTTTIQKMALNPDLEAPFFHQPAPR